MNSIKLVKEFHEVFNHPIAETPCVPPIATNEFRANFIREELDELAVAQNQKDILEFADALGDIQYVLDGWFLNAGLLDKKDAIMAAIHKSNMTKACTSIDHAEATIKSLADVGTVARWEEVETEDELYYVVKRVSDGKVMKALGYSAPDIKTALGL